MTEPGLSADSFFLSCFFFIHTWTDFCFFVFPGGWYDWCVRVAAMVCNTCSSLGYVFSLFSGDRVVMLGDLVAKKKRGNAGDLAMGAEEWWLGCAGIGDHRVCLFQCCCRVA